MPVSKVYKHADTYDTKCKYVIKMKLEMNSTMYLFVQYFRKTAIDCSKSITENFQVYINLLN